MERRPGLLAIAAIAAVHCASALTVNIKPGATECFVLDIQKVRATVRDSPPPLPAQSAQPQPPPRPHRRRPRLICPTGSPEPPAARHPTAMHHFTQPPSPWYPPVVVPRGLPLPFAAAHLVEHNVVGGNGFRCAGRCCGRKL